MSGWRVYSDEQLLHILYTFKLHRGRWPKSSDFRTPYRPSEYTFYTRFGSWKKSIELAKEKYIGKY